MLINLMKLHSGFLKEYSFIVHQKIYAGLKITHINNRPMKFLLSLLNNAQKMTLVSSKNLFFLILVRFILQT